MDYEKKYKYIDTEKLIAEIERYKQGAAIARFDNAGENADYFQGKVDLCDDLTHLITSLQQDKETLELCAKIWREEQGWIMIPPDVTVEGIESLLKQVRKILQQEQPDKYETALEKAREWMPNVNQGGHAILIDIFPELGEGLDPRYSGRKQEQPDVDLEKELDQWRHDHFKGKRDGDYSGEYLERESQLDLARHFYELGLNTRKEEI